MRGFAVGALVLAAVIALVLTQLAATKEPGNLSVAPAVSQNGDGYEIRLTLTLEGETLTSDALPFPPPGAQITPSSMADVMGDGQVPNGLGWFVGVEENSIGLAVQVLALEDDTTALLVHQIAGFEHVKRAYVVLRAQGGRLATIEQRVEGPGPATISALAEDNTIVFESTAADGARSTEVLQWQEGPEGFTLVPAPKR